MKAVCTGIWLLLLSCFCQAETVLTESLDGEHDQYCANLLHKILNYGDQKFSLQHNQDVISQNRDVASLMEKKVDVIWIATSKSFEKRIRPIRIPIFKGLLGHRVFVIQKSKQAHFNNIQILPELKKVTVGQGSGWVDTDIFRSNGFTVLEALDHDHLYSMLSHGRFEALPRGLHEPWEELDRYQNPNITVEENHIIIYPLPMYFFVNNENSRLAKIISTNFEKMVDDGSFDTYFFEHPKIKNAIAKSNLASRKPFFLNNPFLPKETPLKEKKYWFNINNVRTNVPNETKEAE